MTAGPEEVRDAYSRIADVYIGMFGTSAKVDADDLAFIRRHLAGANGPVLDVGCGPGHITDHLRSLGVDATGIDMVPEFLAYARETFPDGRYRLGVMDALDVADHSVAGILAWYSMIHLPDPGAALAEFRRALTPGGTLVIGFIDGDEVSAYDHKVVTAYRRPVSDLAERLTRAGFTEIEHVRRPAEGKHQAYAAIAAHS